MSAQLRRDGQRRYRAAPLDTVPQAAAPRTGAPRLTAVEDREGEPGWAPRRRPTRLDAGRRREPFILLGFDVLAVATALLLTTQWATWTWTALYALGALASLFATGAYEPRFERRLLDETPRLVMALAAPLFVVAPLAYLLGNESAMVPTATAVAGALYAGRWAANLTIRSGRRAGWLVDRTVIVGTGQVAQELARSLTTQPHYGLEVVGFVESGDVEPDDLPLPILAPLDDLDDLLEAGATDSLLVAFGHSRESDMIGVLRAAVYNDVELHVVPRFFELGLPVVQGAADEIGGIPLWRIRRSALRRGSWRVKRTLDVVVSGALLVATAPIMALIAVTVRTTSPGPVLFRQQRIGQNGQPFELLKFRSMPADHRDDRVVQVAGDGSASARLPKATTAPTRVGAWLRTSSLDELPQLVNVLKGDMSLIGPRPERPVFVDQFASTVPGYSDRHRLPVGLTGWSQVNGLRQDTSISRRASFDNYYIERWSLWLDIQIVVRTVSVVLRDLWQAVRR